MSRAKAMGHQMYEIERNFEFISDMNSIFSMTSNKQHELLFSLNSGDSTQIREQLGQLLLSDAIIDKENNSTTTNEIDLFKFDESGMAAIHYACRHDHHKMLELLLSFVPKDRIQQYINLKAEATVSFYLYMHTYFFFLCCRCLNIYVSNVCVTFDTNIIGFKNAVIRL